ncbi:MAG: peptidoglycan DD-metalloendopeptidase family protein [Gallionella sp.]|jgi:murein DD-endopeptidase MepM/ murein hydrolase activator NlpD|nr:peptidoglycan DD-metalloendopeptidase family protein [Gallionella sp.]
MLPQNLLSQERKLKLRWFVTLSTMPLLGVLTAFGLVPESELGLKPAQLSVEEIILPVTLTDNAGSQRFWRTERMQRGDTVVSLLQRLNVDDAAASQFLRTAPDATSFRKLPTGTEIQAETSASGALLSLRYLSADATQNVLTKEGDGFLVTQQPAQLERRLFVRTGEIQSSLYAATDAADVPDGTANQLVEIFSGDIDFHHDLRRGDKFTVIYEMTYNNGALVDSGRIQAAEFVNRGQSYRAVYFSPDDQRGGYYTPEGKSLRKAFLRSPIAFSRVSSGFSNSRFHPVLNKWRAHKGVDFAAPTGTPVKVTADGIVDFAGRQGGYGNVIMVKHSGNRYTTVYGHLSRYAKGLRHGQRVSQGDVIGYVGMTGVASGPHLHYEFRVGNQQRDPLRVALPTAKPLSTAHRAEFQAASARLTAQLEQLRDTNLAKLD